MAKLSSSNRLLGAAKFGLELPSLVSKSVQQMELRRFFFAQFHPISKINSDGWERFVVK
jgi:hypothetical protein